mmetsp:Transcript_31370/g.68700  ORF Transcript_31370/g.68700 Transcript_31370/m.68700 type:complete len:222 (+) Transcript_31370:998-1663(+)
MQRKPLPRLCRPLRQHWQPCRRGSMISLWLQGMRLWLAGRSRAAFRTQRARPISQGTVTRVSSTTGQGFMLRPPWQRMPCDGKQRLPRRQPRRSRRLAARRCTPRQQLACTSVLVRTATMRRSGSASNWRVMRRVPATRLRTSSSASLRRRRTALSGLRRGRRRTQRRRPSSESSQSDVSSQQSNLPTRAERRFEPRRGQSRGSTPTLGPTPPRVPPTATA